MCVMPLFSRRIYICLKLGGHEKKTIATVESETELPVSRNVLASSIDRLM